MKEFLQLVKLQPTVVYKFTTNVLLVLIYCTEIEIDF